MAQSTRNFFRRPSLNTITTAPMVLSGIPVFALRSLLPIVADAIPRRFSSSSLPPSFASGRFAVLCIPGPGCATALSTRV